MASATGQVEYQSSADTTTFSTIMRDTNLVANTHPVYMQTYIDHPMINAGEIILDTADDSSCICQTSDLKVNLPVSSFVETARLSGTRSNDSFVSNSGSVTFANVEYCKDNEGQWPLVSVFVKTDQSESFGTIIKNIAKVTEVETTLQGIPVSVSADDPNLQVYSLINGRYYFRNYDFSFVNEVYGFEADEIDFYSIDAYDFEDIYDVDGVDSAYLFTSSVIYTDDLYQPYYLEKPYLDYAGLANILDGPGTYAIEDNYGYDYVLVSLNATSSQKTLFFWSIIAPLSGKALDVDKIDISQFISDSVLETYVDGTEINIGAWAYEGINGYQEYLTKIIDRTPDDLLNSLWSKRMYSYMHISTSGQSFADLGRTMSINAVASGERKQRAKPEPVIR